MPDFPTKDELDNPKNIPTGDINPELDRIANENFGRGITEDERAFIFQPETIKFYGNSLNAYLNGVVPARKAQVQQIVNRASALGLDGLTNEEATSLSDQFFSFTDPSTLRGGANDFFENVSAVLQRRVTDKQFEELKKPPERAEVTDDHRRNAEQLLRDTFGPDEPLQADAVDFFAGQLAEGVDPFLVRQDIEQTRQFQDLQSRRELERRQADFDAAINNIQASSLQTEEEVFRRAVPDIISQFQRAGRLGSSGLESALSRVRGDLAREREQFINNLRSQQAFEQQGFSGQNFQTNSANAINNFLRQIAPQQVAALGIGQFRGQIPGLQFQNRIGQQADLTNRLRGLQDFNTQRNDFLSFFERSQRAQREADLYGLYGQLGAGLLSGAGQGIGASFGGF